MSYELNLVGKQVNKFIFKQILYIQPLTTYPLPLTTYPLQLTTHKSLSASTNTSNSLVVVYKFGVILQPCTFA